MISPSRYGTINIHSSVFPLTITSALTTLLYFTGSGDDNFVMVSRELLDTLYRKSIGNFNATPVAICVRAGRDVQPVVQRW